MARRPLAAGGRSPRTAVAGPAYVAAYGSLWVGTLAACQWIVFRVRRPAPPGQQVGAQGRTRPVGGGETLPRSD